MHNYKELVNFLNSETVSLTYKDFFKTLPRFSIADLTALNDGVQVRFSPETSVYLKEQSAQFIYKGCIDSNPVELSSYEIEVINQTSNGFDVILKNDEALLFERA